MPKSNSLDTTNGDDGRVLRDSESGENVNLRVISALDAGLSDIDNGNYEEVSEENTDRRLRAFKSKG